MTTLTIDRLSSAVHGGGQETARRVERMLGQLADRRLDDALREVELPPGLWCVRRLAVSVQLDFTRPDSALETDWATAVINALRTALTSSPEDVTYFSDKRHAIYDLVRSLAVGQSGSAWAWRRLDLLGANDPEPENSPGAAIIAALRRNPQYTLAAMVTAIQTVGPEALDRVLGTKGWTALAELLMGTLSEFATYKENSVRAEISEWTASVLARSSVVAKLLRSRLRPTAATVAAWAVLVVAEADPGAFSRPSSGQLLKQVAEVLVTRETAATPVAATKSPVDQWSTDWAGLPFLLATAEDADIPSSLLADPTLAKRPLRWILHALGGLLVPLAEDDPAVLALAGLDPTQPPPTESAEPATPAEQASLYEHAQRWAAVTAERLAAEEPAFAVENLARRNGHVVGEPGWLEVFLRLDEVDIAARKAGLDIDPGWLPWLGTVMRFRYA